MKQKLFLNMAILLLLHGFVNAQTINTVGGGTNDAVINLNVCNGLLYAGGYFSLADNKATIGCGFWNGFVWDSLGPGSSTGGIPASFAYYNGYIYAGGDFWNINNIPNTNRIAKWDGTQWSSAGGSNNDNFEINSLIVYKNELYAAGRFTIMGNTPCMRIAKYNGSSWQPLGSGIGGFGLVTSMAIYNDELYVAGDFSSAGGIPAYNIAKWNGTQWDSVGGYFDAVIYSLAVDTINNVLYAGGLFDYIWNQYVHYIAKWDGNQWYSTGSVGNIGGVTSLCYYHGKMYAGGNSATPDSVLLVHNGTKWNKAASPNSQVETMAVYKDELYVGGLFTKVNNDTTYKYIFRYSTPVSVPEKEKKSSNGSLGDPKPNPFNSRTLIPYLIEQECTSAKLMITDITGKTVQEYSLNKDRIAIEINMDDYNNGTYLYSLVIDGVIINTRRMALSK